MNPPPALYGAMNRERKPFTYTPGGLDLSEIKSERMAKRLMRNAMNQGVPETPVQPVVAPPTSSIPVAIPNFNCLPVQVFPTFQLPSNPKTLLRTRSNPDGSSEPTYKTSFLSNGNNKSNLSLRSSLNTNKPCMIPTVKSYNNKSSHSNNIREETDYNCNLDKINNATSCCPNSKLQIPVDENNLSNTQKEEQLRNIVKEGIYTKTPSFTNELENKHNLNLTIPENNKIATVSSFGENTSKLLQTSYNNTTDNFLLPEVSYQAEYLTTFPEESDNSSSILTVNNDQNGTISLKTEPEHNLNVIFNTDIIKKEEINNNKIIFNECDNINTNAPLSPEIYYEAENIIPNIDIVLENQINVDANCFKDITDSEHNSLTRIVDKKPDLLSNKLKDDSDKKKEVKTVKKHSEKEIEKNEVENHNGDTEAAVVVKLPSKKSEAKTETQVEVIKKVLPDGSIEEITKTITKTTIDGRTEIKTRTETKTIPKEDPEEEEYEEEDKSDEIENEETENLIETVEAKSDDNNDTENYVKKENNINDSPDKNGIITQEEKSETSLKKKVVIIQSELPDSEEEEEVIEEIQEEDNDIESDVEEVIVLKNKRKDDAIDVEENISKVSNIEDSKSTNIESEILVSDEEENDIVERKEVAPQENEIEIDQTETNDLEVETIVNVNESEEEIEKDLEEEEEIDTREDNDAEIETKQSEKDEQQAELETEEKEEAEEEFEEAEEDTEEDKEVIEEETQNSIEQSDAIINQTHESDVRVAKEERNETIIPIQEESEENKTVNDQCASESSDVENKNEKTSETIIPIQQESTEKIPEKKETEDESKSILLQIKSTESLREASVPLEKVEEVEIKPIGPTQEIIKKSHTEIITTKTDSPSGALSTQTEYNVIENFVTVNRVTKTLDHAYEQAAEHTLPIIRSYIPPNNTSMQPTYRPYQSSATSATEPDTERRHSLLLDRISVERQIPPVEIYQNNYSYNNNNSQGYEETQYLFQPQSEILEESNVKPSIVSKNQQWYQQTKKDNFITNNNIQSGTSYNWNPPQQQVQPKPQAQLPQPLYQPQFVSQPQPQPQFQSSYVENTSKDTYKTLTDNYNQNINSYASQPSWVNNTSDIKPTTAPVQQFNQYSLLNNQSTDKYQLSTQQLNSSYVPPPWEQTTGYVIDNINQNIYQPPSSINKPIPKSSQTSWEPNPPPSKFTKSTPTSYIPPAPNQSFVKPVNTTEPPKLPGRKTYYSEYERRYISVPESTYIPTETKYQAQPNPSPVYYYDNNEPAEIIEPQWRKELREFTEKSQTSTQISETSIRPPWEDDPKYGDHNLPHSTPTWSQTLRPQSWRERSYEPEYTGVKELPKTNTLGRGRPQSSYLKNNMDRIPERPRGVSVDRYNPNSYQSPVGTEHPPVQSQTLDPSIHPKPHYNPNVPGYHARATAEPREHPTYSQPRLWAESRAPPIQSRSFKYLQWITGTED